MIDDIRIVTARLILEPLREDDAPALNAMRNDPFVRRYAEKPTESLEQTIELLRRIDDDNRQGRGCSLALRNRCDLKLVGSIGLWRFDRDSRLAEIGYASAVEFWNRGLMREAMAAFLPLAVSRLEPLRIEARVRPSNEASIRLLLGAGFKLASHELDDEGDLRYERVETPAATR